MMELMYFLFDLIFTVYAVFNLVILVTPVYVVTKRCWEDVGLIIDSTALFWAVCIGQFMGQLTSNRVR